MCDGVWNLTAADVVAIGAAATTAGKPCKRFTVNQGV